MRNTVCSVQFDEGCYQQKHHPLVVEIGDIGLVVGKPVAGKSIDCIYHRDARQHEEDVIDKYTTLYQNDIQMWHEMNHGGRAYERIARERYFMKADDEDIFVLSTDLPNNDNEQDNETTE